MVIDYNNYWMICADDLFVEQHVPVLGCISLSEYVQ